MSLHPEATYQATRPDIMLAEAAKTIADAEGVDLGTAQRLAEERDPALSTRYRMQGFIREQFRGLTASPPRGLKMCEAPADVELAERSKALAAAEGTTYAAAERRILAENPKLASRYKDFRLRESALDELAYRAYTIRSASGMRMTEGKALDAALAEDPTLREAVYAYFEPDPYKSTT